jgi:hypothetical protein
MGVCGGGGDAPEYIWQDVNRNACRSLSTVTLLSPFSGSLVTDML